MNDAVAVPLVRHHTAHELLAMFNPGPSHMWGRLLKMCVLVPLVCIFTRKVLILCSPVQVHVWAWSSLLRPSFYLTVHVQTYCTKPRHTMAERYFSLPEA